MIKEENPTCMRCGHELEAVKPEDYMYPNFDEDDFEGSVSEWRCPYCGAYHSVTAPDEESKKEYPAYNEDADDSLGNASHGYPGFCPECGSHIIWQSDFMRSEVWGDVDEDDVDENGLPKDDSLVTYVLCPHCGAYIEIVDAKPSELKDLPISKEE